MCIIVPCALDSLDSLDHCVFKMLALGPNPKTGLLELCFLGLVSRTLDPCSWCQSSDLQDATRRWHMLSHAPMNALWLDGLAVAPY